ncbi:hypothetical protein GETHLI_32560 [Geothrix limicola]|uniref:SHOCT domain-containing protein n=1 Tax=Geothrix limicola TaxID=2927978 RepID=A0ABQ5QIR4_9BACT|nr:SHOCT domain-containing protein [Geothrix limicola]GLH74754.1 hypothetical protein GETHLI_32560 [Geothrix limicola]
MRVLKNILIAVGLLIAALILGGLIDRISPPRPGGDGMASSIVGLLIFGTTLWASISTSRLEFRRYKTGMSYHPVTIFVLHLMFWIVVFPYFLTVRDNIRDGSSELKDEFKHEAVPPVAAPAFQRMPTSVVPPPIPTALPVPPLLPRPQASTEDRFEQLRKLAQLKDQGILNDQEFQAEKQKILGQA